MSLNKKEIKDWVQLTEAIEVIESYGVRDMKRQKALENKASEEQTEIMSDYDDAISEYDTPPQKALKRAEKRLLRTVRK